MFTADTYTPTRVVFGVGKLRELATVPLPGRKALICAGPRMEKLGIQARVLDMLANRGIGAVVYNRFTPNPLKRSVMEAAALAHDEKCDFVIGLGGGSSIDAAKAVAIVLGNGGDLWDYASVGSGKKKAVETALPVVAISTTAGTGTETDPYSVITNEGTREKLDFAVSAIFPAVSIIDPELMATLPRDLTIYQGFDALFHAAECYITNENENRLVDLYAGESVRTVAAWLPVAAENGANLEARCHMAYAADILSGYTQALTSCTSHHIIAQSLGGWYQDLPHGAALLSVCEAFYTKLCELRPALLDDLGAMMGTPADPARPGFAFVDALTTLMDATGVRNIPLSRYGASKADMVQIAEMTVDIVGIDFEKYTLSKADVLAILETSFT